MRLPALALLAALALAGRAAPPPHVLVILADDMGPGEISALHPEHNRIPTPHLDRLAAEGMVFTDAHSGSAVCTPTRYGLLTGRYAWRTRLQQGVLSDYDPPLIDAGRLTLPTLLRRQGYHSACIGKWHLGFTLAEVGDRPLRGEFAGAPLGSVTRDGPVDRGGFHHFFGFHHARKMRSFFTDRVADRDVPVAEALGLLASRSAKYIAERAKTGSPFFLYLALNSPHTPIAPSAAWQGRSPLGPYGDFVLETDAAVGTVLDALTQAGVATNTLVIFTADNGFSPEAGRAKLAEQGHFPSGPYRGHKADIWEGGHRVPFLARWPGRVPAGTRSDHALCLIDLFATLAELAGLAVPDTAAEDSFSFLPVLLGQAPGAPRAPIVHHSINGRFALREGDWKLALCAGSGGWSKDGGETSPQLYQLSADPGETRNRATAEPERVREMTARLQALVDAGRSRPGPPARNDRPVDIHKRSKAKD
jgi:arylsulfatase A-like enzyme